MKFSPISPGFLAAGLLSPLLAVAGSAAPRRPAARSPRRELRIAVLQAGTDHSRHGNPGAAANFALFARLAREAAAAKPDLIVFPEYAVSGWPYPPEAVINGLAEAVPGTGPWFRRYQALAKTLGVPLLGWMVEQDGKHRYNTAVLLDARGRFAGKYRKVHANLGEQTWWGWSQGQSLRPLEFAGVHYGISICADMWFPETVRCEELYGADLVIHMSIADDMDRVIPARAFDSQLPIVAAIFNGGSYAVDAEGRVLGKLPARPAAWKVFRLQPFRRHLGFKYGGIWDIHAGTLNLRNIEAYGILVDPATRPPWTQVFLSRSGKPQTREQLLRRFHGRYDANDPTPYHQPLVAFDPPWTSPFTVDPAWPAQFINREGRHLFLLNKTAWMYFGCKHPEISLRRARALGANVLRAALEADYFKDRLGIDLWPWGGARAHPRWDRFDKAYWNRVERRVRLAGKNGIGLDIVLYGRLHPGASEIDQQRPYWEQILRRLSRYANIFCWEIANEYTGNERFQAAAARFLKKHDPYHRPVCTSAGTGNDAAWPEKPWLDLAVNHSCRSSRCSLRSNYLAVARNTRAHAKPAWCNESGREHRHGNDDGVHRRKQGWLWCMAGCFWSWHSGDGCEHIDDPTYAAPGQEFVRPMADFFRSLPFWKLAPAYTVTAPADPRLVSAVLATPDRTLVAAYACTEATGETVAPAIAGLHLPPGKYQAAFLRPSDGAPIRTIDFEAGRKPLSLPWPGFTDDLLLKIERRR